MLIEHPELKTRLKQVLGGEISGHLSVQSLKLYALTATVELKISFEEGSIPPKFRRKSKNCLIIFLDVPDFALQVGRSDEEVSSNEVEVIKANGLTFYMGGHKYQISSQAVYLGTLQSVNEMDLVDQEW